MVILLTACINPNGMSFTKLQDATIRRSQYELALDFYLSKTNLKIVFVENTNTYIGTKYEKYVCEGRLEFITFSGNSYQKSLGKGYGEALIIREAIKQSHIICQCNFIVKITGRLIVENINALLTEFSWEKKTVAANCSTHGGWVDSYFFIAPCDFFV